MFWLIDTLHATFHTDSSLESPYCFCCYTATLFIIELMVGETLGGYLKNDQVQWQL